MAKKAYKRFVMVSSTVVVSGILLWFSGRLCRVPHLVDFAEVAEAFVERSWLTTRGTNGGTWVEMALPLGARDEVRTNFFSNLRMPKWSAVEGLGESVNDVYMDGFTGGVGTSRRGRLVWYAGEPDFESGVYSREGDTLTFDGWRVCLDDAGLADFERVDEGAYIDWSPMCTNFEGVTDASGFGETDGDGTLTGFAYQDRLWKVPMTNELEELRGCLTNMQGAMLWGATPSRGYVTEWTRTRYFSTNNTNHASGWSWDQALGYGWDGIFDGFNQSPFSATTNYFGGDGQKDPSVWEYYITANVMVEWNYYTPYWYLGDVLANVEMQWMSFWGIDFDWPSQVARTNGVVTRADVYVVGCDPQMRWNIWTSGGVVNEFQMPAPEDMQWVLPYMPQPEWETNEVDYLNWENLMLRIIRQKGVKVGEVGTPFGMGVAEFPMPEKDDLIESVFVDSPEGAHEDKQWFLSKQFGFMFVIVPVCDFLSLTDAVLSGNGE